MMKTALTASAVLFGISTLAMAQTSPTSPPMSPTTPPSSSGTAAPGSAGSGSSRPSTAITGEEIKEALEQRGYSDVQVQPGGSGHRVTAMKDGKQVRMEVDPTGRVTQSR